jgi:putative addiction module killer protein
MGVDIIPFQVEIHQDFEGKSSFVEWVGSIHDRKTVNIVQKRLGLLRMGNMGDYKFFEGLYELRIDYGPGYRIYCGKKDKAFIIVLCGGSKASQKKDIEKALRYWEDFKKRSTA